MSQGKKSTDMDIVSRRQRELEHDAAAEDRQRVLDYWTPERMAEAVAEPFPVIRAPKETSEVPDMGPAGPEGPERSKSVDGAFPSDITDEDDPTELGVDIASTAQPWTEPKTAMPASAICKVFSRINGVDRGGSGCVVNSEGKNLVFTAGHMVHDFGVWAEDVLVIPGYPEEPRGRWVWFYEASFRGWTENQDRAYDVGLLLVAKDAAGRSLANRTGSHGIATTESPSSEMIVRAFGYPGNLDPESKILYWVSGSARPGFFRRNLFFLASNMGRGASGGPWLRGTPNPISYLQGVTAGGNSETSPTENSSPHFGLHVWNLYESVRSGTPPPD